MKIIDPSVELINRDTSRNPLEAIEIAGRVCYKSEENIKPGSAERFVQAIIRSGHEAVLEHGSIVYCIGGQSAMETNALLSVLSAYYGVKIELHMTRQEDVAIVSGNIRAWRDLIKHATLKGYPLSWYINGMIEENPVFFPEYQEITLFHKGHDRCFRCRAADLKTTMEKDVHQCITLRFICDRGVSHELVRHRKASYCQESTRYCNYSGDRFGGEITVIRPCFWGESDIKNGIWTRLQMESEAAYLDLLQCGASPQEARTVLTNSLKTEVVMTTNIRGWRHFISLRNTFAAHPQMKQVAEMAEAKLVKLFPWMFYDMEV